jgi:hypothetical protein
MLRYPFQDAKLTRDSKKVLGSTFHKMCVKSNTCITPLGKIGTREMGKIHHRERGNSFQNKAIDHLGVFIRYIEPTNDH